MTVLITGATGLVGKALTKIFHTNGISVHYLTTSKNKIETRDNYKGFYWNSKEGILDEACLDGVTSIIHLAGATIAQRWTGDNKKVILDSRVETAQMLYTALQSKKDASVKHFISASAIGGYPSSLDKVYDETYPTYASGFLGEVVEAWEEIALQFQKLDIATAIVRTGIILDEEDGALPKIMQPIAYGAGAPLGSGKQWQSWIHKEDMAAIYYHLLQNELTGIYNGVAPHPVTNEELTKQVAKVLDKPLLLPKVPKFALKLMLGDMATIVLESQNVSASKIEGSGYNFKYRHIEAALQDLLK